MLDYSLVRLAISGDYVNLLKQIWLIHITLMY